MIKNTLFSTVFILLGVLLFAAGNYAQAPDPPYPSKMANDGARHCLNPEVYLGSGVDAEEDCGADIDEDDGIQFTSALYPNNFATLRVRASVRGYLNAWVDFNGDGDWDDANEQIFKDTVLQPGFNPLSFRIPGNVTRKKTYARFRFSTVGGLSYKGDAVDGEVEDYALYFGNASAMEMGFAQKAQELPDDYYLMQNFPNPFNPTTSIHFMLKEAGITQLQIFNIKGEKIRTLVDGHLSAGQHTAIWDGKDEQGVTQPSGIYLYQLRVNGFEQTRRMELVK